MSLTKDHNPVLVLRFMLQVLERAAVENVFLYLKEKLFHWLFDPD